MAMASSVAVVVLPSSTASSALHRLRFMMNQAKRSARWNSGASTGPLDHTEDANGDSGQWSSINLSPRPIEKSFFSEEEATNIVKVRGSLLTRIGQLEECVSKLDAQMKVLKKVRDGRIAQPEIKVNAIARKKSSMLHNMEFEDVKKMSCSGLEAGEEKAKRRFLLGRILQHAGLPAAAPPERPNENRMVRREQMVRKKGLNEPAVKRMAVVGMEKEKVKSSLKEERKPVSVSGRGTKASKLRQLDLDRVFSLQGIQGFAAPTTWESQHAGVPVKPHDRI